MWRWVQDWQVAVFWQPLELTDVQAAVLKVMYGWSENKTFKMNFIWLVLSEATDDMWFLSVSSSLNWGTDKHVCPSA